MRTRKEWRLKSIVILAMLFSVLFNSCDEEGKVSPQATSQTEAKVSSLLDQMYAVSDGSEDEAIMKAYESLSPQEFTVFQNRRFEKMSEEAIQEAGGKGRLTEAQLAAISARIDEVKDFTKAIEKKAIDKYGTHTNKLNLEQLGEIADEIGMAELSRGSGNGRTEAVQACTRFTTNVSAATETNNANTGYHYRGRADNDVNAWDCDFVFHFSGNLSRVRGERLVDRLLIRLFSGIARRIEWVGGYPNLRAETRLLFGNNRYRIYFGNANHPHLRMSNS